MLIAKLVNAVEDHREAISQQVIQEIRRDARLRVIRSLPDARVRSWGTYLIESFRIWVESSDDEVCADSCYRFGRSRFEEKIPFPELIRAFHICRERVVSYLRSQGFEETAFEIYVEEEAEHDLAAFFDFALYHAARAYEDARQIRVAISLLTPPTKRFWRKVLSRGKSVASTART